MMVYNSVALMWVEDLCVCAHAGANVRLSVGARVWMLVFVYVCL